MSEGTLGPFELLERIGRGGMGEVWRGRHVTSGTTAAIKLVIGELAGDETFRRTFHNEVRAVAGLDHPNIVRVYDYGHVDPERDAVSQLGFAPGAPWLAMELAPHGSLEDALLPASFGEFVETVRPVLGALAHAHARGLVHRDLKPANILVMEEGGQHNQGAVDGAAHGTPRLALTDFGIAHQASVDVLEHDEAALGMAAGTPVYMAPEQFMALWRDYGPWTDLYALGCMAWELVTGAPPFRAGSVVELANHHIRSPLPRLVPLFEVPAGLDTWLARLLAKDMHARFARAADAAQALEELGLPGPLPAQGASVVRVERTGQTDDLATAVHVQAFAVTEAAMAGVALEAGETLVSGGLGGMAQSVSPTLLGTTRLWRTTQAPLPGTWREAEGSAPMRGVGAGLGLFGMREIPLVDREDARDAIWGAFRECLDGQRPRAVLLRGEGGVGKSRVLEWATRRMHELGQAAILRASHGPIASPLDGLSGLVAQAFTAWGLPPDQALARIHRRLQTLHALAEGPPDPHEILRQAREIAALLHFPAEAPRPATPLPVLTSDEDRYAAFARLLACFSGERPVILWLDNLHFGSESLGLALHLLKKAPTGTPVLVLGALRPAQLLGRPLEREFCQILAEHPAATVLDLGPLAPTDHAQLLQEILPLTPNAADLLSTRTAQSPQFAVDQLAHLVHSGQIQLQVNGFGWGEAHTPHLANHLAELAQSRLHTLAGEFRSPPATSLALEVAAALGAQINPQEWWAICEDLGVRPADGLVDALVRRGLARVVPRFGQAHATWYFTQEATREALEAISRNYGRWSAIQRSAARHVAEHHAGDGQSHERQALHWLAAGEDARASLPLIAAIEERLRRNAYREAMALVELHEGLAERLGWLEDDPRRLRPMPFKLRILRFTGALPQAKALCHRLGELLEAMESATRSEAQMAIAGMLLLGGGSQQAHDLLAQAIHGFQEAHNQEGMGRAQHSVAWLHMQSRRFEQARQACLRALACAEATGNLTEQGWALSGVADACANLGLAEGEGYARAAMERFELGGARVGYAVALRALSEFPTARGDLEEARRLLERSREICEAMESMHVINAWNGLQANALLRGDLPEAARILAHLRERHYGRLMGSFEPLVHGIGASTEACLGNFVGMSEELARCEASIDAPFMDNPALWRSLAIARRAIEGYPADRRTSVLLTRLDALLARSLPAV